jgi:hypothetical protein
MYLFEVKKPEERLARFARRAMVAAELRRQADVFLDIVELQPKIGRDPAERRTGSSISLPIGRPSLKPGHSSSSEPGPSWRRNPGRCW